ncbi:BRO family protein [Breoghania corrubedonensis]|uniref:BRO family protein n=2 Tax=Breoghania corrubedonensis TaxID=665038 RepID=A0A2T5VI45_9HYPH|nr:BRO family protein [Breoghania corrubedonensis]PTW63439.1 BRO family protein [Breoghania corrubedonensis]
MQVDLSNGRVQLRQMHHLSESGLYKLIMRSDKPEAKPFQDWVTREDIPSIRKNGGTLDACRRLRVLATASWRVELTC